MIKQSSPSFKKLENYLNSLKHNENILGVYLFGSYAKGKQKETSDIDLCIFTKEGIELHDIEVLGREEGFDIHLFDKLPELLKFKIFKEGKSILINNKLELSRKRRKFLHSYRAMYSLRQRNKLRVLNSI